MRKLYVQLFGALHEIKRADITTILTDKIVKQILGRGVDMLVLNDIFGTPGRTAATKTKTTLDDLLDYLFIAKIAFASLYTSAKQVQIEWSKQYLKKTNQEEVYKKARQYWSEKRAEMKR